jgi:hypothetical protein
MGGNKMGRNRLAQLRLLPALVHLDLSGEQRTDSNLWGIRLNDLDLDTLPLCQACACSIWAAEKLQTWALPSSRLWWLFNPSI